MGKRIIEQSESNISMTQENAKKVQDDFIYINSVSSYSLKRTMNNDLHVTFNPIIEYVNIESNKKHNYEKLRLNTIKTKKDVVIVEEMEQKCLCTII